MSLYDHRCYVNICTSTCVFTQPLRTSKMRQKVIFKRSSARLSSVFSFS